jgi:hypothetical protein
MSKSSKPRILTFDIETAPLEAYVWQTRDVNIGIDMIKEDFTILCFAGKFVGERDVITFDNRHKRNFRDDKDLTRNIIATLRSADILCSQNGISFDLKKITSRAYFNDLPPYSLPQKHVDLLREGRRIFGHTSHKLAWITQKLDSSHQKSSHAEFPGFELWKEVMQGNPKAWTEMVKYCAQDVRSTEAVYHDYIRWFDNVDLRPFYTGGAAADCRACGTSNVTRNGTVRRKAGRFQTFICNECGCTTTLSGQKITWISLIIRRREIDE